MTNELSRQGWSDEEIAAMSIEEIEEYLEGH